MSISLGPDIFRSIPALPLTTNLGDLNVLLRPTGAPGTYDELLDDASTVELDTVPTLIPTTEALLRGLAGGAREPHPEVIARLRQLTAPSQAHLVAAYQPPATDAEKRGDLEQAILATLARLGYPATVRDLLFAIKTSRRPSYKQAKTAAESLTSRGWLLRDKDGTAHRYQLNTDADDKIAHEIAALLTRSLDVDGTIARALKLVALHATQRDGDTEPAHQPDT